MNPHPPFALIRATFVAAGANLCSGPESEAKLAKALEAQGIKIP